MNILVFLTDLFLHLDVVVKAWVVAYPGWIYLMLFAVVFMETGAVVTPFLPGDSLLFAAGAISAKHGGKTVSLARFFPVIRTFAPFLAGISRMSRGSFALFNLAGAAAWVSLFLGAGYFLGTIPFVANNLEYIVIGIISFTIVPATWEAVRSRRARRHKAEEG